MWVALRASVMLAVVMPLFAATAFRPAWWQTLLTAMVGAALGQMAVRATRGHRVAAWSAVGAAAIVAAVAAGWMLTHTDRHDDSSAPGFLVVRSAGGTASLTWDDVRAIQTKIPSIDLAVPYLQKTVQLVSEDQNWSTQLVGTTPEYFDLRACRRPLDVGSRHRTPRWSWWETPWSRGSSALTERRSVK